MSRFAESTGTTSYYGLPHIKADIYKLAGNPTESAIRTIWLAILAYTFRVTSDFSHSYESDVSGGVVVVKHRQQKVLVVKCKAAQCGTKADVWTAAAEQLQERMKENRVYGAVAIGGKVRFYEYDGREQRVVGLKGHEKEFDLAGDCEGVQKVLDSMRDGGR
ncbi:uncharacterized protein EI97DRAFT_501688 [Westerdykella ornata]|uniref:Type I restriction enzyme R protein N-terminal domain-containing protein n=1 Tax=Westerdykella ornata TaxID=318751 RepID=A0A6A6JHR2_WESOR|nr:uncharacterized protein EI97DRAFT_501688 [Westerdykella ornata]KAF2275952.1 hypothetical protein EI97DRAFT_501688 [Westerdykella ornata]